MVGKPSPEVFDTNGDWCVLPLGKQTLSPALTSPFATVITFVRLNVAKLITNDRKYFTLSPIWSGLPLG